MTDTTSAALSLLPCPFCLRKDTVRVHPPTCDRSTPYNPADRAFPVVRCHGCGASMDGEDWDQSGRTAVESWNRRAQATSPAVMEPFTAAQRERMFRNRPSDVGKDLSLADWHRVLQYVEACHGIGIKKGEGNG